jgi:DNA-binding MarR family transcriptional regulator
MKKAPRSLQKELRQTTPFRSAAQEAAISILRTADVVRRRLSSVIEPHGITLQQHNVLRILRGGGGKPLTASEVGDRLIEQTPGVTRLLDRLEDKGLVRRERSAEDRRVVYTWITDAGRELLRELDDAVDRADEEAVGSLTREQCEQLSAILEQVRRW